MFYILVGAWMVFCIVHCLITPEGRRKFKALMK